MGWVDRDGEVNGEEGCVYRDGGAMCGSGCVEEYGRGG